MTVSDGTGKWVRVANLADFDERPIVRVQIEEHVRVIVRCPSGIYALDGICTHEEAELGEGDLDEETLFCPLHASGFDVRTGEVQCAPADRPLATYEVRVDGDEVLVKLEARS